MTTTAPALTAPVDDPDVQDALRRLQLQRYPGISGDPARWLYAAAHQSTGTSPDDVDPDDPDWHAFQTAWSHFGDYDRDQLALVLGWATEMDDVEFVDRLHALRVVQAEHRRLQPIAEWLALTAPAPAGGDVAEIRGQLQKAAVREAGRLLSVHELAALLEIAGHELTTFTGEVIQDTSIPVLAAMLRPELLRFLSVHATETGPAPVQREHVARVLAVALHSDCPDDELQHAAGAHGAEALRLVDALTAAGLDVRSAVPR